MPRKITGGVKLKVIENSARRLRLRLDGRGVSTGICSLDRERCVAHVVRYALGIPYRRRQIALSQIMGVAVKRKGDRGVYYPMLELRFGEDVSIGGYTKEDAMKAARAIRDFLKTSR